MSTVLSNKFSNRLIFVDQLKGFAIFMVVIGHVYNFSLSPSSSLIPTFISFIHMPVFMFIAGYMFYRKEDVFSWRSYFLEVVRKFKRVFVPFISLVLLACLYRGWSIVDLMMNEMKYGYWFVFTLFMLYVVYYPFLYVRLGRTYEFVLYTLTSIVLVVSVKYIQLTGVNSLLSLSQFAQYSFPFLIGVWLRKHRTIMDFIESQNNSIYTILLLLFISSYYGYVHIEYGTLPATILSFVLRFVLIGVTGLICWIFFKNQSMNNRIGYTFSWLGKNSLPIYLLHYYFLPSLSMYQHSIDTADSLVLFIVAICLSVVIIAVTSAVTVVLAKSLFLSRVLFGIVP